MKRSITVGGRGTVVVAPDCARVQFGVQVTGVNAQDVLRRSNAAIAAIVAAVAAAGVDRSDLQTSGPHLWPGDTGYSGSQDATVLVRDVAQVGSLIDAVAEASGPNLTMHGVSFSVLDPAPHVAAARRLAVEDAYEIASQLAAATGCAVGEVWSISEGRAGPGGVGGIAMAKLDLGAVIEPGSHELAAEVTVTYRLTSPD